MVNEARCNAIAITDLLQRDHPLIAQAIQDACNQTGVKCTLIENASDYWCRDFMPMQVNDQKFVQFRFNPAYYKYKHYSHLKTDLTKLNLELDGELVTSELVIDGGNICYFDDVAIATDRIFKDNNTFMKAQVVDELVRLLELDQLIIIPALPYDTTGHADGMVKFIDKNKLLINDFRLITGRTYWNRFLKALSKFDLVLLPNDLHLNSNTDDAMGDYINMCVIGDRLLVPAYNRPTDRLAHEIIEMAYPHFQFVPVIVNELAVKAGVLHCATWNYRV